MAAAPAPAPSPPEVSPPPLDASASASASASDDEWDADGFVIPDVTIQDDDDDDAVTTHSVPKARDPEPQQAKEEKIYLGPHGAPPSGAKQQQLNTVGRKQSFRNKLKEADRKSSGNAQENKVESLRELMGAVTTDSRGMAKSSRRDWLDPHCRESEFDRKPR
ncbi:unnamed protein product [Triticum turgidum subsp. durum]|uniref:Uncharacterized protein n=1 Tax=Triticum turgidum subsp. durum TaxID=4567 RepID=A0A9R1ASQ1_TRITD|nr:unnamed protein product [Triticum turgidum subsp. durum]